MSLTITNVLTLPYRIVGNEKETVREVSGFPTESTEGGEPITNAELGLNSIEFSRCELRNGSESETNPCTSAIHKESKIKFLNGKTSKEMAKEKDMSKVVVRVYARGT